MRASWLPGSGQGRFLLALYVFDGYHRLFIRSGRLKSLSIGGLMSSVGSLTRYVHELRSPDSRMRDEAARIIWERFSPRLKNLVRRHLDNRILRREDEQDVLQSMFASFCHGQSTGKTAPASREELGNCWSGSRCARSSTPLTDTWRIGATSAVSAATDRTTRAILTFRSGCWTTSIARSPVQERSPLWRKSARQMLPDPLPDCRLEARGVHQRRDLLHDRQDRALGRDQAPVDTEAPRRRARPDRSRPQAAFLWGEWRAAVRP